jgi:Xaa-Pro aminopeptidase
MNYSKRIENLQNYILEKNLDLLIINDPVSLIYLTGLEVSYGKLFITKDRAKLFVDGRYIQVAKENTILSVDIVNEKNLLDFIIETRSQNIGFDSDKVSYHNFEKLNSFMQKIQNKYDFEMNLMPIFDPLKEFRVIKDLDEISIMKKAATLNWKGLEHVCLLLKEDITEKEIALEFEMFVRKNGADSLSFDPIVCFGKNSAMPHHIPSNTKLKKDDIILMDVGVCIDNYNSDMTRVMFFGRPDPIFEKIYSVVQRAQTKALSLCKPNTKLKDLDLAVKEVLREENYEKEYIHSLGHGVGLEIHEFPRIKFDSEDKDVVLRAGMVITIEPGIYIPNVGGVRYEDMILITNDGYENFYSMN